MHTIEWKITTGCERLSPGCDNCPTYWQAKKENKEYEAKFNPSVLIAPLMNNVPSLYLVSSGSDLFHGAITADQILKVFEVMTDARQHKFEIVTKRAERLESIAERVIKSSWGNNITVGVAVEEAKYNWRIDSLRKVKARRMVSFGPMVGRIGPVNLEGIESVGVVVEHWGPNPREVDPKWIEEIQEQCESQGVKFLDNYFLCEGVA
tara:strand:- start:69 stop:689 length:621 start_codon:yes stop_codon:yes gene_type:complete